MSGMDVPRDIFTSIEREISSEESPVGIDAKKTHIIILHKSSFLPKGSEDLDRRGGSLRSAGNTFVAACSSEHIVPRNQDGGRRIRTVTGWSLVGEDIPLNPLGLGPDLLEGPITVVAKKLGRSHEAETVFVANIKIQIPVIVIVCPGSGLRWVVYLSQS